MVTVTNTDVDKTIWNSASEWELTIDDAMPLLGGNLLFNALKVNCYSTHGTFQLIAYN